MMMTMMMARCSGGSRLSSGLFFTDGSARKNSHRETCAGVSLQSSPFKIVANNTAEMQALIEALFWLKSCVERQGLPISSKVMVTMDSLHVKGLIDVRGEGEQGAGNLTLSRVEYDREKAATSHAMSTGTHW